MSEPSPIEARALSRVKKMPRMTHHMVSQHQKGRADYGHSIDECGYSNLRMTTETADECADLITYLEALACPQDIMQAAQKIASWLEGELGAHP